MVRFRARLFVLSLLALAPSLACGGPVCDLARAVGAEARFSSPLSSYAAIVETSDRWLRPERLLAETGEERDGLVLVAIERAPTVTTLSCRDGVLVERDGQAPEATIACEEGFGLGDGAGAMPAEARVRLSVPESESELLHPPAGFASVEPVPVEGEQGCPVQGYVGMLPIQTDALVEP